MIRSIFVKRWVILLILLSACMPAKPSVIKDNSCDPPCWNGITPGITTKAEMIEILRRLPVVNPDSIITTGHPWKSFNDILRFTFIPKVNAEAYFINDVLVMLSFSGKINSTFGEAIDKLGEPQDLLILKTWGPAPLFGATFSTIVLAVNPEKGVSFGYDVYDVRKAWRNELRPEIGLSKVAYFDPAAHDRLLEAGMFSMGIANRKETLELMKPWQGYIKLPEG